MLVSKLEEAPNWESLISLILEIPSQFLQVEGTALLLYYPNLQMYKAVAEWNQLGKGNPSQACSSDLCFLRITGQAQHPEFLPPCMQSSLQAEGKSAHNICMPLNYADLHVGMLRIQLQDGNPVCQEKIEALNSLNPQIARSILLGRLRQVAIDEKHLIQQEHNRIARHIHDTLAHDLAYLRLRLDQILERQDMPAFPIYQDLYGLREVADHCYEQVRQTLSTLLDEAQMDLVKSLKELATLYRSRSQLEIELITEGQVHKLPGNIQRLIVYILREALRNIEKHAQTQQATVILKWKKEALKIEVSDQGIGFDMDEVAKKSGHYGLIIMRDCVASLSGSFKIDSSPQAGTKLSIRLPVVNHENIGS